MPTYDTTIGEDLPVEIEYEETGRYLAPTKTSPSEWPEIKFIYITVNGCNILKSLSDRTLSDLRVEIQDQINEK